MLGIGKLSDEDLMKDEKVLILQHPSWQSEFKTIATALISAAIAIALAIYFITNTVDQLLYILPLIFLAISIFTAMDAWIGHVSMLYAATSFRVVKKTGIFRKRIDYVPYTKIQNVSLRKGFTESLVDVGDILIDVAGSPGVEMQIHNIKDPERFHRIVMEYMQKKEGV